MFCEVAVLEEETTLEPQSGPLLVINGVVNPRTGLINGFAWGYNPTYKG